MEQSTYKYDSASKALYHLKEQGYTVDFNIEFDELTVEASDYEIDQLYRYEGMTDPADESTVYGIRNVHTGKKGVFVAGDLSLIEGKKRDIILDLELRYRNQEEK